MKQFILAAACFFVINSASAQDDDRDVPANVVKLNVGSLFLAHGNLSYQRALGNHFAIQVSGMYGAINVPINPKSWGIGLDFDIPFLKSVSYQGWGVVPELRYYPLTQTAPRGLYANVFFQYREGFIKNCLDRTYFPTDQDVKNFTLTFKSRYTGIGVGAGYQFMFGRNKNIVLDANVGLKYSNVNVSALWEGRFDIPLIKDPLQPNCPNCYILSQEETDKVENVVNNEIIGLVNNRTIGLGFLSAADIFRSALYIGYAF